MNIVFEKLFEFLTMKFNIFGVQISIISAYMYSLGILIILKLMGVKKNE